MKITGKAQSRKAASASKTSRNELIIKHRNKDLILRTPDQTNPMKIDPALKQIEGKDVELKGYKITGTNVFIVEDFKLMSEE